MQSAKFLESVFAKELAGHKLTVNRSLWRNFPTVRCEKWTHDNIVLIGDAKATAHFSIGSGTKLAMEDAIALFEAFSVTGSRDVKRALAHYETERRLEVEKDPALGRRVTGLVRACAPLLGHGPAAFRVRPDDALEGDHYDNLALRAPEFVSRSTSWSRTTCAGRAST
jgi:anthraniloyl-CoA monooxygenase